jgi:hypothetical protein
MLYRRFLRFNPVSLLLVICTWDLQSYTDSKSKVQKFFCERRNSAASAVSCTLSGTIAPEILQRIFSANAQESYPKSSRIVREHSQNLSIELGLKFFRKKIHDFSKTTSTVKIDWGKLCRPYIQFKSSNWEVGCLTHLDNRARYSSDHMQPTYTPTSLRCESTAASLLARSMSVVRRNRIRCWGSMCKATACGM